MKVINKIFTPRKTSQDVVSVLMPLIEDVKTGKATSLWTHGQYQTPIINGTQVHISGQNSQYLNVASKKYNFAIDLVTKKIAFDKKPLIGAMKKAHKSVEKFMKEFSKSQV